MTILEIKYFTDQQSFDSGNLDTEINNRKTAFYRIPPNPNFNCRAIDYEPEHQRFVIYFEIGGRELLLPSRCVYEIDAIEIQTEIVMPDGLRFAQ